MQQNFPYPSKSQLEIEFPTQLTFLTSSSPAEKPRTSLKQCRICLQQQDEESTNNMIQPCRCLGSIKYVHDSCMKKWIETSLIKKTKKEQQKMKAQGIQCGMCKFLIKFEADLEIRCRDCQGLKEQLTSRLTLFLLLLFVFVVSITGIGITSWIMKSGLGQFNNNLKTAFFYILAICGLFLLSAFICLGIYILVTELFLYKNLKVHKVLKKPVNQEDQRYFKSKNQIIPIQDPSIRNSVQIFSFTLQRVNRNQQRR